MNVNFQSSKSLEMFMRQSVKALANTIEMMA